MLRVLFILGLTTIPAMAQEVQLQQSSTEMQRVLSSRLIREISDNMSCQAAILELQKQIDELKKQLADKAAPKK